MKNKRSMEVAASVLFAIALLVGPGLLEGSAQAPNQVGLVVRFGDGSLVTRCIEFSEPEVDGYDLLLRSGLSIAVSGDPTAGMALCNIEGEGCPASDCFCECKGSTCIYWSYWHLVGGAWQYSSLGASGHVAAPGSVEGWRWGEAEPPPVVPFEEICVPPATDTPEPTPTWTLSPTPEPTETPSPTPQPTDTPSPTPEPTSTWTPSPSPVPPAPTPPPVDTPDPAPTEALLAAPSDGEQTTAPVLTPVSMAGEGGQSHPAPVQTPGASGEGQPVPVDTYTPQPSPTSPPPTATPVVYSSPIPTLAEPPTVSTVAAGIMPTATWLAPPTLAALAPDLIPKAEAGGAKGEQGTGDASGNRHLLTIFSVGAGVAYLFFVLFAVALAGLFVVVRARHR